MKNQLANPQEAHTQQGEKIILPRGALPTISIHEHVQLLKFSAPLTF